MEHMIKIIKKQKELLEIEIEGAKISQNMGQPTINRLYYYTKLYVVSQHLNKSLNLLESAESDIYKNIEEIVN